MSVFILFVSGGVLYFVYITSDRLVVRSVLQSNGNRNVIGSIRHVSCFNVFPVYKFGPFFEPILGWWRHKVESKFQNFQKAFTQRNNSRQSTFYFWFSSFYQHCYMKYQFGSFWHIFGLMTSPRGVKALKHWDWFQKRNNSPQISLCYWLSSFSITLDTWYTTLRPFDPIWR